MFSFSRSRLPFSRDLGLTIDDAWVAANPCYKHLGLYAYQAALLEKYPLLPPGRYELIEKLEQLRVLENGYDISIFRVFVEFDLLIFDLRQHIVEDEFFDFLMISHGVFVVFGDLL